MPKIHSVKEPFDLTHLRMSNPINKNGSHFIKTLAIDDPLYFLAPKCFVKQGFVNHGKKIFCDFVFSNEDSDFLTWLENLEETVRSTIYTNREKWFETPLDEHDIESSMSSVYKFYKSGKFFIVRTNVPTALGKINIKIYDENEEETDPENIKENTNVLAVFEFQGIKCGVRSFQFEIELKQLLVVEPEKLFDKCIISKSTQQILATKDRATSGAPTGVGGGKFSEATTLGVANKNEKSPSTSVTNQSTLSLSGEESEGAKDSNENDSEPIQLIKVNETLFSPIDNDSNTINPTDIIQPTLSEERSLSNSENVKEHNITSTKNDILSPTESISVPSVEILEIDFPLEESAESNLEEPIKLKKRTDVYYKLYKDAREKAREAKRIALTNYLEAKRIKNTYLLEDVSDSDSDLDELDA